MPQVSESDGFGVVPGRPVAGVPARRDQRAAYGGSELGEVDRAGRILKKHVGDDNAWFETWRAEGDRARPSRT